MSIGYWIKRILKIIPRYCKDSVSIVWYWLRSRFWGKREQYKDAWLIAERGIEARDNGFAFFRYLREQHPEINAYYLIATSQTSDYEKVKPYGNIIPYNSAEHWQAIFYARYLLSTHVGFITPWSYVCQKKLFPFFHCPKFVLLNHGITKEDIADKYNKFVTGVDLFIAANQQDYDALTKDKRYGYSADDVALTGYARYDNWYDFEAKRQIVLMPTWRAYLVERDLRTKNQPRVVPQFEDTQYYRAFQRLLESERLAALLERYDMRLIFYPHYEMQSAIPLWHTTSSRMVIGDKQRYDIPELLKESKVMITDYSGVGFDFAYMHKPLIYYQFDQDEYYQKHYFRGDFYDMETEGLGEVVKTEEQLLDCLENILANDCKVEEPYEGRIQRFFTLCDQHNCERIFAAVQRLDRLLAQE